MEGKKKLAIAKDAEAGMPISEIAKKYHVATTTAARVADEFGVERRTRRAALTEAEIQEILGYYDLGWGAARIAKKMGLVPDTVQNYKPGSARLARRMGRLDKAKALPESSENGESCKPPVTQEQSCPLDEDPPTLAGALIELANAIKMLATAGKEAVIKVRVNAGDFEVPAGAELTLTKIERMRIEKEETE